MNVVRVTLYVVLPGVVPELTAFIQKAIISYR